MALGRKTGGRKKNTPNKRNAIVAAQLDGLFAKEGLPLMLELMRDPNSGASLRFEVARYLADRELGKPKMQVEAAGKDGSPIVMRWVGDQSEETAC